MKQPGEEGVPPAPLGPGLVPARKSMLLEPRRAPPSLANIYWALTSRLREQRTRIQKRLAPREEGAEDRLLSQLLGGPPRPPAPAGGGAGWSSECVFPGVPLPRSLGPQPRAKAAPLSCPRQAPSPKRRDSRQKAKVPKTSRHPWHLEVESGGGGGDGHGRGRVGPPEVTPAGCWAPAPPRGCS